MNYGRIGRKAVLSAKEKTRCTSLFTASQYSIAITLLVAIESAALAEKLLNDLLKTTEGFQKLKKINEELKSQSQNDSSYV